MRFMRLFVFALVIPHVISSCGDDVREPLALANVSTNDDARVYLVQLQAQGAIPEADVNRDGVVDIQDLVIVARNFGETVDVPDFPTLELVGKVNWYERDGHPRGDLEVRNNGALPVEDAYVKGVVRTKDGQFLGSGTPGEGESVRALIPAKNRPLTFIPPGGLGQASVVVGEVSWDQFVADEIRVDIFFVYKLPE